MAKNMYKGVKTWNPHVGCLFGCTYCVPSYHQTTKWIDRMRKTKCEGCQKFLPHEHTNRLTQPLPSAKIIWPCAHGDICFAKPGFIKRVIERTRKYPKKTFFWQSKSPKCFNQYLPYFPPNTVLLTTMETNRNENYNLISKAPKPSVRFKEFLEVKWPRKMLTVEPVLDFDPEILLKWVLELKPECVWFGYNSKPKSVKLPEPEKKKTQEFIKSLEANGVEIRFKTMR
jgi:hypothetical protein